MKVISSYYNPNEQSLVLGGLEDQIRLTVRTRNLQALFALTYAVNAPRLRGCFIGFDPYSRVSNTETGEAVGSLGEDYFHKLASALRGIEVPVIQDSFETSESFRNEYGELEEKTDTVDFWRINLEQMLQDHAETVEVEL